MNVTNEHVCNVGNPHIIFGPHHQNIFFKPNANIN